MGLLIPLLLISFCCFVIWRAGDGFMTASEYVGRNLSEGVRGATINAIASSMPEVFTSLFFLFILVEDGEGFTGGIGTTAGSAIFNSMVIPAVSILAVIAMGLTKNIKVSKKVFLRDGIALIIVELIFLILISGSELFWYHGLILMVVYLVYIIYMFGTMSPKDRKEMLEESHLSEENFQDVGHKRVSFIKAILTLDLERLFIGHAKIDNVKAWSLLIVSTLAIALVCYFLVLACEWVGADTYVLFGSEFHGLGIPVMFVALILASAASSFPDTVISIKDARRGQYDDAISNALGSNIFDVCFALGLPLFIYTMINGPIVMPQIIVDQSTELRFLLWLLTIVAVIIFTSSKTLGKTKAILLLGIYVLFVMYIVARSQDNELAGAIADWLVGTVRWFGIN